MSPTAENMRLVRSATSLVRSVLGGADIAPLREFRRAAQSNGAATSTTCLRRPGKRSSTRLQDVSRISLHDVVRRVAQIERDALASVARRDMDGNLRTAYAG